MIATVVVVCSLIGQFAAMVRVFFPNMYMKLLNLKTTITPPTAKLHVSPRMTKFEVKEYLTKIYNIDVIKVMTVNMLGKESVSAAGIALTCCWQGNGRGCTGRGR